MRKNLLFLYFLLFSFYGISQDVFFNEVNYNVPSGSGETQFFEIAGPSGTDLTEWEVIVYDETSMQTASYSLSGTIPANGGAGGCNGIVVVDGAVLNVIPGSGMALINELAQVEQYITFDQPTTAPSGTGLPIEGLTSQFIPLSDLAILNNSLQLIGTGLLYPSFTWAQQGQTLGATNTGQEFLPCASLPVELVNFSGNVIEKNIELQWQTASEIDHSHFQIMYSLDGTEFRKSGEVKDATYESSSLKRYDFIFQTPKVGSNYFRLDQVDLNGIINRSNIIYISFNGLEQQLSIYPNPAQENIRVVLDENINSNTVWIQVLDGHGKVVMDREKNAINFYSIDISSLENGMYFLRIFSNQQQWQTKFVKEKYK